ncbi:hypothetical protein BCU84_06000 [Shewanella sp. 10N.286.51.B7]|uniref:hypothetical protein n=1 Tax=Shewanella sp. 10N.286.51.B7 TaxID=1880836 RepID=UPI000C81B099|nr:hypothetical protein [Shewanella sp. 10N.286.51.B7]PMG79191.1 hypothetical protein BCU84_06000 [Shewanella sp. 10N.286.51.B7]
MIPFTITRLHTNFGIIKAKGLWEAQAVDSTQVNVLEQLSTDGWVELDVLHPANGQFIAAISPLVFQHLLSQQSA